MSEIWMHDSILEQLKRQLNNFWADINYDKIKERIDDAYELCMNCFSAVNNKYLNPDGKPCFLLDHSGCWCIFLYYLSRCMAEKRNTLSEAEKIYYLNKILHSVDWYCGINLPNHFMVEHPLGSVLGRADYGDYLFLYQGTTIGGNVSLSSGKLEYPTLGNYVVLFSNAKIIGGG